MWRAISPNLYKISSWNFQDYHILYIVTNWQIVIKFWYGSCPGLHHLSWNDPWMMQYSLRWHMQKRFYSTKIGFQSFFLHLLLLIQYLLRWHYKKRSYVTKIGFQSFFVKLLFYWCKILLCDFSKIVMHHRDRVSMFFGQLKVFSWVFMNDLTYDKVTYTIESVSNTTRF